MHPSFQTPREPPTTVETLVERLAGRVPEGADIVLVDTPGKVAGLDRWIIGAVDTGGRLRTTEVWLATASRDGVYPALASRWSPIWGAADCASAAPSAVVSWSLIWTAGRAPLRVWNRRELLLDRADTLVGARVVADRGGLRLSCVVDHTDGTSTRLGSRWIDPFDDDGAHERRNALVALAQRINEAIVDHTGLA